MTCRNARESKESHVDFLMKIICMEAGSVHGITIKGKKF